MLYYVIEVQGVRYIDSLGTHTAGSWYFLFMNGLVLIEHIWILLLMGMCS